MLRNIRLKRVRIHVPRSRGHSTWGRVDFTDLETLTIIFSLWLLTVVEQKAREELLAIRVGII